MSLRSALLVLAAALFVAGLALVTLATGENTWIPGVYLVAIGLLIGAAVLFERHVYRPQVPDASRLRKTSERLVDPITGQLMEVWEDPKTGAREYRPAE